MTDWAGGVAVVLPAWVGMEVDWTRRYATVEDRMRLTIALARLNVERRTGGPFGAAVVEAETGRLVAVGTNRVVPLTNSLLHAETVALMLAEARLRSHTLRGDGLPAHELVTSCDPCDMCLGAIGWSGVARVVAGADRADARALGFDEGSDPATAHAGLVARGVEMVRGVCREEARAVLALYRERGGMVYNG